MKHLYNILSFMIVATFCGCSTDNTTLKEQSHDDDHQEHSTQDIVLTQKQVSTVSISLGKLDMREMGHSIRANGKLMLKPQDNASVAPIVGGNIKRLMVAEGSAVCAGQVVAYIENSSIIELQQNYLTACKELDFTRQEYARQKKLVKQKAGIEKNLQQASCNYEMTMAKQNGLKQQLLQLGISPTKISYGSFVREIPVRTPISGTVYKINCKIGSYVNAQNPLMEIANSKGLYASLNVFEKDLAQVRKGQSVDVQLTYQPEIHMYGTVERINQTVNSNTKSVNVQVSLAPQSINSKTTIQESNILGTINTSSHKVETLPDDAIISNEGKNYVFQLIRKERESGMAVYHFKPIEVIMGCSSGGFTQVTFAENVDANALFVKSGAFYIGSMMADHGEH